MTDVTITPRRRQRLILRAFVACAMLVTLLVPPSQASAKSGIELVAQLPIPWLDADEDRASIGARVGAVDAQRQRLYLFITRHRPAQNSIYVAEYDTSTDVPTPLRISK